MKLFKSLLTRLGLIKKVEKEMSSKEIAEFVVNKRADVLRRLAEYDRNEKE